MVEKRSIPGIFFLHHPYIPLQPATCSASNLDSVSVIDEPLAALLPIYWQFMPSYCVPTATHHSFSLKDWPFTRLQASPSRVRMACAVSCNHTTKSRSLSLSTAGPIEAVLFDIDGTLCDSDPLHFEAFRELLQKIGFQDGVPIDEEFFIKFISGKHNEDIAGSLFPDWDHQKALQFMDDKEVLFRRLANEKLVPVNGLHKLCKWIEDKGLRRAAVTNAPRPNAELIISILGLSEFFEYLIIGGECERAKPYPDPYLKALNCLAVSSERAIILEDSASGIKAGVAAGVPVVGITTRNPDQLLLDAGASLLIKDFEDPNLWSALEEQEAVKACS